MAGSKAWKSTWGIIDWKCDPQEVVLQKVEQLLSAGAAEHINARDWIGERVLTRAAEMGYESVVERLFAVPNIDVNAKNTYGHTALMSACGKGHLGIVEKLLAFQDIDVNAQDFVGTTALMAAVVHRRREVVKLLLAFPKINTRMTDNYGNTALSMARWNPKETKIIGMLKSVEIELKRRDFLRDELRGIRAEFSSDKMRRAIPNTAQRLWVRRSCIEKVKNIVGRINYLTKA